MHLNALIEMLEMLEAADSAAVLAEGFCNPHSWRGSYWELAFEPAENVTVGSMLDAARSALGATYPGWKGGDYTMTEWSEVHLAYEGTFGEPLSPMAIKYMLSTAQPNT